MTAEVAVEIAEFEGCEGGLKKGELPVGVVLLDDVAKRLAVFSEVGEGIINPADEPAPATPPLVELPELAGIVETDRGMDRDIAEEIDGRPPTAATAAAGDELSYINEDGWCEE